MTTQMVEQLLRSTLSQIEASARPVRAAALLRIARVMTRFDQAESERLIDRGLAVLAELPEEGRAAMAPQVISLIACVSPDRAFALRATIADPFASDKFLYDMVEHGHAVAAADYLTRWSEQGEFPFDAAQHVIGAVKDDDRRRLILWSALRAWRDNDERDWHSTRSLVRLFRHHWSVLSPDVARDAIAEIIRAVQIRTDQGTNASVGGPRGTVTFSSQRPSLLFELLGPLQLLDPGLVQRVIRDNTELARAAEIYPSGLDSVTSGAIAPPSTEVLRAWQRNWTGFALNGRFFRIEDEKNNDFRSSFEHALRRFARDAGINKSPADCWPSTEEFRTILHAAGRYEGASGARLLDRIPDPTLRLFAQIEFAAGMAGLAQIGGVTREQLRG